MQGKYLLHGTLLLHGREVRAKKLTLTQYIGWRTNSGGAINSESMLQYSQSRRVPFTVGREQDDMWRSRSFPPSSLSVCEFVELQGLHLLIGLCNFSVNLGICLANVFASRHKCSMGTREKEYVFQVILSSISLVPVSRKRVTMVIRTGDDQGSNDDIEELVSVVVFVYLCSWARNNNRGGEASIAECREALL